MLHVIKNHLADIFDLHPKKSPVSKVVDKVIYLIIAVSTLGIILETQPSTHKYLHLLENIESFIIAFFLVELVLQLSVIRTLFARHPTSQERLTIMFYLVIDILAILPPVILFFNLHQHFDYFLSLRLIRIFKIFRHDHSVEFIVRAVMKKRTELLKSIALTIIFTVFLSVVLFEVENNLTNGRPSNFTDILTSLWWSLDVYMDEVSGYVKDEFRPVTSAGMFIAGLMGLMKIAIVVIPTGIVASGFIEVIEEDKVNGKYDLLRTAYRKKLNSKLGVQVFEQPHSLITIKNALNFSDQDIYKILEARDGFRMRSIMSSSSEKYSDINIIEHFAYGDLTTYGAKSIRAGQEVLIVCPNNFEERGMSYFAYCLSVVIDGSLIANEKYRINSLNPDFDFDYLNSRDYFTLLPNGLKKEEVRALTKPQRAFYCFISNISAAAQGRKIVLMQSNRSVKTFEIAELRNEPTLHTNIEKWLLAISPDAVALKINPDMLDEDREYKIVLNVKEAIEPVIGRKFTSELVANLKVQS
jgi:voltage-gated potassium channel